MRKYTDAQIDDACTLREQGLTFAEISRRTGMHEASVLEHCQIRGAVSPTGRKCFTRPQYSVAEAARALELRAQGATTAAVGRELGWSWANAKARLRALAYRDAVMEEKAA